MKRKDFPNRVKDRREGALYRLQNPSNQLKERIAKFSQRFLKNYKVRVASEIAILQDRTRAIASSEF